MLKMTGHSYRICAKFYYPAELIKTHYLHVRVMCIKSKLQAEVNVGCLVWTSKVQTMNPMHQMC